MSKFYYKIKAKTYCKVKLWISFILISDEVFHHVSPPVQIVMCDGLLDNIVSMHGFIYKQNGQFSSLRNRLMFEICYIFKRLCKSISDVKFQVVPK